ncbi:MAG TPA: hypothetical protein PLK35_02650 [Candidatus Moranbacteria bacterium]|nr:hypothetical protein [Candidatus Moranbacteria bacterium]
MDKQISVKAAVVLIMAVMVSTIAIVWFAMDARRNVAMAPGEAEKDNFIPKAPAEKSPETGKTEDKASSEIKEDVYNGWNTYVNDLYKYKIKYPVTGTVKEAEKVAFSVSADSAITIDEAYKKYTGKVCVTVETKDGTVTISAPPNTQNYFVIYGRTGMGVDTKVTKSEEKINISGKEYTVKISDVKDPDSRSVEATVSLEDKTTILYTASTPEKSQIMKKVVESFERIK